MTLAYKKIREQNLDIILIQEPYQNLKGIFGYECFKADGDGVKVVTLVRKSLGQVWMRRDCLSENVVVVELALAQRERTLMIVNVYDEPPRPGDPVSKFRDISGWLENRRESMIVAGDLNARNVMWGGEITDARGEALHEWMVFNGWRMENDPTDPPSFFSNRGTSWVDLVMSKGIRVCERSVDVDEETLSDHRYITYEINAGSLARNKSRWRYEVRGVNWQRFERRMNEEWLRIEPEIGHLGAEEGGTLLQGAVEKVCKMVLRKRGRRAREVREWWNEHLENERREVRRVRRNFQEGRGEERAGLREEYVRVRNLYKNSIKEAKFREMDLELENMGDRV